MRLCIWKFVLILPTLCSCALFAAGTTPPRGRAGTWDFWIPITYQLSTTIDGQGGSSVDVEDSFGFGMGFGYNFNDQFQLGGVFDWSYRGYDAQGVAEDGATRRYRSDLEMGSTLVTATYYLLPERFTPFVAGSLGYTFVDTNIPTGERPYTTCYYDPWWGYYCEERIPTRTEGGLSYGLSLGARYDVNDSFGLQLSYSRLWFDELPGTPDFDQIALSFLLRY